MVRIDESVVLIRISRLYRPTMTAQALYEATRKWWVVNPDRGPEYAFSIFGGVVKAAGFEPATRGLEVRRSVYEDDGARRLHEDARLHCGLELDTHDAPRDSRASPVHRHRHGVPPGFSDSQSIHRILEGRRMCCGSVRTTPLDQLVVRLDAQVRDRRSPRYLVQQRRHRMMLGTL